MRALMIGAAAALQAAGGVQVSGVRASQAGAATPQAVFSQFSYEGHWPAYQGLKPKPDQYLNPILEGFYPDPSIVRVGQDYYLVNSSFGYFPAMPVFHSRDLVNWTPIGSAVDRPSQLDFGRIGVTRGVFAPDISFHDGTWYLVNTCIDCGGNYLLTAKSPAGPWSDPVWLGFDGIDPSLFFDADGRAWLVNNGVPEGGPRYDGHRAIWLQEFDPKANRLVGPRRVIVDGGADPAQHPRWIEGPHLLRHDGWYYLIAAEGGTEVRHSEVAFRSRAVEGPYVAAPQPILTQRDLDPNRPNPVTSTGHADLVQTPKGDWWAVFLGVRPYKDNFYNTGRETFLAPVRWIDGWPQILAPGEAVRYLDQRPKLSPQPRPPVPTQGDFAVHDAFKGPRLALGWEMLRTPRERWWRLSSAGLALTPRPEPLGGTGQPSFLGRRQQHVFATASVTLRYAPARPGDKAGLAAFQNESHYLLIAVAKDAGGQTVVQAERRAGAADPVDGGVMASAPLHGAGPVRLRIEARGGRYDLDYAEAGGPWRTLVKDADGTQLSTETAGGFVGVTIGPYAYAAP
jgi:xylan 1,4-beta-xylosidase